MIKANRKVMKKILVMFTLMMVAMVTFAKDIKTVVFTTTPQMHSEACENKIKSNLRFEKGIKSIVTSVPDQTVPVLYNAGKTTTETLQKGFEKFVYKDIKTVVFTTTPQMHSEACENKIKSNLRFEKGIKSIVTSVPDQTVPVLYNAGKTTTETLQKGFEKFVYKARILKDGEKVEKNTEEKCDLM